MSDSIQTKVLFVDGGSNGLTTALYADPAQTRGLEQREMSVAHTRMRKIVFGRAKRGVAHVRTQPSRIG